MMNNTTTTGRITTTIEDALADLNTADQELAEMVLVMAGAVNAYELATGKYVGFTNAASQVVAYLPTSHGYLTVTPRADHIPTYLDGEPTPDTIEAGGWDVRLDKWKQQHEAMSGHIAARKPAERAAIICPTCFLATPILTGVCERCND